MLYVVLCPNCRIPPEMTSELVSVEPAINLVRSLAQHNEYGGVVEWWSPDHHIEQLKPLFKEL